MEQLLTKLGVKFELYGFEACKLFYNKIISDKEIIQISKQNICKLFNLAIADREGEIKLYHHRNRVGHSIYSTKNLISEEFETIPCTRFSKWLETEGINLKDSINILRMNIEGAIPLIKDIIDTDLRKYMHLMGMVVMLTK